MKTSLLKWNRTHAAIVGLLVVTLVLIVANTFRTTPVSADESYDGMVMSSSESMLMVRLNPDSDARGFKVANDARITKDGEKSKLEDLATGDHVTIAVVVKDSEEIATSIFARSPM